MRNVDLHHGLKVGDKLVKSVVIREDTVGDEDDALKQGLRGPMLARFIEKRRVHALGTVDDIVLLNPAPEILGTLKRVDWSLIVRAQIEMDVELEALAGLAETKDGGRDEPGGKTPGHL